MKGRWSLPAPPKGPGPRGRVWSQPHGAAKRAGCWADVKESLDIKTFAVERLKPLSTKLEAGAQVTAVAGACGHRARGLGDKS